MYYQYLFRLQAAESDRAVEAEEDAEWKRELLYDNPGLVAEKLDLIKNISSVIILILDQTADLHGRLLDLLHLECVDDPDGEIADEEEGDDLSARLAPVLPQNTGNGSIPTFFSKKQDWCLPDPRCGSCAWRRPE